MLDELITRTNKDEFYNNWELKLESIHGAIKSCSENNFEVNLYLENIEKGTKEYWRIEAYQVLEVKNIFMSTYLPYVKLTLLYEHPLLWQFKYDELEGALKGDCNDFDEFVSNLQWLYEEKAGRYIDWRMDFFSLLQLRKGKKEIPISMNMKTYDFVKDFVLNFGFEIEVVNILTGEDKGYLNEPNAKILMLGNPDVSPYDNNLGQPYIIAEKFTAKKTKNIGT